MAQYRSVSNINQGTFNNPRQKTWGVMSEGRNNWSIELTTNSFEEAKEKARQLLSSGGQYMDINSIMVIEIVPIDTVMTPSV